jgi:DNA-binding transcriptional ArsR family regulator
MSLKRPMDDLPITDPQTMRALAHPVRLAALSYLQANGPATATQLSEHVGASPSVTSWHLRHLEGFGLVTDVDPSEVGGDRRQRYWRAMQRGFSVEMSEEPESQAAGSALMYELFATAEAQLSRWLAETEPRLEPAWRRVGGPSNSTVVVTTEELEDLQREIITALARYARREPADVPEGARSVRVLHMYLPEDAS